MTITLQYHITEMPGEALTARTDGIDIFFNDKRSQSEEGFSHVWKYDVALNSVSKFIDESDMRLGIGGDTDMDSPVLAILDSTLYVGRSFNQGFDHTWPTDPIGKVWRVNMSSGALTEVLDWPYSALQLTLRPPPAENPACTSGPMRMYCNGGELVAVMLEKESGAYNPVTDDANRIFHSQHTSNGTSWSASTWSGFDAWTINDSSRGTGIFTGGDYRSSNIWDKFHTRMLGFNGGNWSPIASDPSNPNFWELDNAGHFWTANDMREYTDDYVSFTNPSSIHDPMVQINMPYAMGMDFSDRLRFHDESVSPTTIGVFDTFDGSGGWGNVGHTRFTIRLDDGTIWIVNRSWGDTWPDWSIWKSSVTLDPTPNSWGFSEPPGSQFAYNRSGIPGFVLIRP